MMAATKMIWRRCLSAPNYDVSDCGELRRSHSVPNQPGRRLRGFIDIDGYIRFSVVINDRKTSVLAHRMVAEAFIGPAPSSHHQVAHNDGSRLHNVPQNLRWALFAENEADRVAHGTRPVGERNPKSKITEDDVRYIRQRYREIKTSRGDVGELDRKFHLCRAQIIRIARGAAWSHVS